MNNSFLALPSLGLLRAIPGAVCRNFTGALEVLYRPPGNRPPGTPKVPQAGDVSQAPRHDNNKQSVRADLLGRFPHLAQYSAAPYAVAPSLGRRPLKAKLLQFRRR